MPFVTVYEPTLSESRPGVVVFGWIVISIILASAVAGAIAACWDDEKGLGKEFLEGI